MLNMIRTYFGEIGNIVTDKSRNKVEFRVSSLEQLISHVFPHLDNYSLITKKPADYLLFRQIVILKSQKLHLSEQGLQNVVNIRARLN